MPRNTSGVYTLPPSNPVTSGTVIATAWANPTLSDIANALTGSLSRDGFGGMRAAFYLANGTQDLPGLAFANEPGMGWYRESAGGKSHFVTANVRILSLEAGRATIPGTIEYKLDTIHKRLGFKSWLVQNLDGIFTTKPSTAINGETWADALAMTINPDTGLVNVPALTVAGIPVTGGAYLPLTGGTLTGLLTAPQFTASGSSSNSISININNTIAGGASWALYSAGGGVDTLGNFGIYNNGVRLSITPAGSVVINGSVSMGINSSGTATSLSVQGRATFAANNEIYSVFLKYAPANIDGIYLGVEAGAAPSLVVSNQAGSSITTISNTGALNIWGRITANRANYAAQAGIDVWGDGGNGVPGAIFNVDALSGIKAVMQRAAGGGGTLVFGTPGAHNLGLMAGNLEVMELQPTGNINMRVPGGDPIAGLIGGVRVIATNTAQSLQTGFYVTSPFGAWMQTGDSGGNPSYGLTINPLGGETKLGTAPGTATRSQLIVNYQGNSGTNYYDAQIHYIRNFDQANIVTLSGGSADFAVPVRWSKRAAQTATADIAPGGTFDFATQPTHVRTAGSGGINVQGGVVGEVKRVWWQGGTTPVITGAGGMTFGWSASAPNDSVGPGVITLIVVDTNFCIGFWSKTS